MALPFKKESKKVLFLVARPLRWEGGGLNGGATREKELIFFNVRKKVSMGGGLKALVAGPLRKKPFFAAFLGR